MWIPCFRPDKFMMTVVACLPGKENLGVRKTIARWSSLQVCLGFSKFQNPYGLFEKSIA